MKKKRHKIIKFFKEFIFQILYGVFLIALIALVYLGYRTYTGIDLFYNLKTPWVGNLFEADSKLGFKTVPNSSGKQVLAEDFIIPINHDQYGFRTSTSPQTNNENKPSILFLGGSHSYGHAVKFEETFPYLTSQKLNLHLYNAATPSYGLAQMYIQAQEYIPKLKPKYVIIQHSPWLTERAIRSFAPSSIGILTNPYFIEESSYLFLKNPIFDSFVLTLPFDEFKTQPKNLNNLYNFLAKVAYPLYFHDDYYYNKTQIEITLNKIPLPTSNKQKVETLVYSEIKNLCQIHGCQPLFLKLSSGNHSINQYSPQANLKIKVADANQVLWNQLEELKSENYIKKYSIHHNNEIIDSHPNATAHSIIAETLIKTLQSN